MNGNRIKKRMRNSWSWISNKWRGFLIWSYFLTPNKGSFLTTDRSILTDKVFEKIKFQSQEISIFEYKFQISFTQMVLDYCIFLPDTDHAVCRIYLDLHLSQPFIYLSFETFDTGIGSPRSCTYNFRTHVFEEWIIHFRLAYRALKRTL